MKFFGRPDFIGTPQNDKGRRAQDELYSLQGQSTGGDMSNFGQYFVPSENTRYPGWVVLCKDKAALFRVFVFIQPGF